MERPLSPEPPLDPEKARRAALALALRWLAAREYSAAAIASRLKQKGFGLGLIDDVVTRLTQTRSIDDSRAVRACARTLVAVKLRGRQRAQRELEAMGFLHDQVRQALDELIGDADEIAMARRVLASRLRGRQRINEPAVYRRLYAALFRRGFSAAIAREALKPYWTRGRTPDEPDTIE